MPRGPATQALRLVGVMSGVGIGVFGIIMGVLIFVLRKPFARDAIRQQNAFWGFRFGERDVRISEYVLVLVAISFVVMGLLTLLGILDVKPSP